MIESEEFFFPALGLIMHEVRKVLFLQESKQNGGWLTFEGDF